LLGFEVVEPKGQGDDIDWVLLRLNGAELMLNTAYEKPDRPPVPDSARLAAHEDTALYFCCPDEDAANAHLRSKGVKAEAPTIASYGMKQLRHRSRWLQSVLSVARHRAATRNQWREVMGAETVDRASRPACEGRIPSDLDR
jgi:hypothetical protein